MVFVLFLSSEEGFVLIIWKEKWQVIYEKGVPGLKRNHSKT